MKVVNSLEYGYKQSRLEELFYQIMDSGRYSEGVNYEAAEQEIAAHIGPAKLVNSCGSALFAAFSFYKDHGHNWAVIQNNTFYATGRMALEAGICPVLCDSSPECPSMGVESLMRAVDSRTKLVVLTHVAGWVAKDYEKIARFCKQNGLVLLEDCAHVFGVSQAGTRPKPCR
jgi:perosamine synthetase